MAGHADPLLANCERAAKATPFSVGAAGRPLGAHEKAECRQDASPIGPRPPILTQGGDRVRIGEPFQPAGNFDARLRFRRDRSTSVRCDDPTSGSDRRSEDATDFSRRPGLSTRNDHQ